MTGWDIGDPAEVVTKQLRDYVGEVALVVMGGFHERWITEFSKKAARVAAINLSGSEARTVLEERLPFGPQAEYVAARPKGSLTLVRIAQEGKAIKLMAGGDYDKGMARAWIAHNEDFLRNLTVETITAYDLARNDPHAIGQAPGPSRANAVTAPQFAPAAVGGRPTTPMHDPHAAPVVAPYSEDPMVRDQMPLPLDETDEPAF